MKVVHAAASAAFALLCLSTSLGAHAQGSWALGNYSIISGTTTETVTPAGAGGTAIYVISGGGGGFCEAALYGASPGSRAYASANFQVNLSWGGTGSPTINARVRGKARLTGNVTMQSTTTGTAVSNSLVVGFDEGDSTSTANPFDATYYSATYLFGTSPTTISFGNVARVLGQSYGGASSKFLFELNAP